MWLFSFHQHNNYYKVYKPCLLTFTALQKRKLKLKTNFYSAEPKNNTKSSTDQYNNPELFINCKKALNHSCWLDSSEETIDCSAGFGNPLTP